MKVDLRRIETRYFILCILLFFCIPVSGQETSCELSCEYDNLSISITLYDFKEKKILTTLENELRSEIIFDIQIYKKRKGVLFLLGDKLLHEYHPFHEAHWDQFNKQYSIKSDNTIINYTSKPDFFNNFFSLKNYPLRFKPLNPENYYLLSRIRLETVKLVPPLTILSPVLFENKYKTPWRKYELPIKQGSN